MNPVWLGPYIISRHIGKGLHELKSMEGKVLKAKANINRLKIYKRRVGLSSPSKEDSPSPSHGHQVSTDKTRCLKRLPVPLTSSSKRRKVVKLISLQTSHHV